MRSRALIDRSTNHLGAVNAVPSSRARPLQGATAIALVASVAVSVALIGLLVSAPQAMSEDGPLLVDRLARAERPVLWYHAAYLPLGWLLMRLPAVDGALFALLLVSAACSVAALGFAASAARRVGGAAWLPVVVLLASPGWWVNGSRVEVHGCQLMGAAMLLWAICAPVLVERDAARSDRRRALVWLALAGFVALTMHRTNLGLLPVAALWWLGRIEWRRLFGAGAVLALGAVLGSVANRLSGLLPSSGGDGGNRWLIENFRNPFTWEFVHAELLAMWAAPLVALVLGVALGGARARRLVAGALPLFAFFVWFGVRTTGGYFSGVSVVFAVAGAAAVPALTRWSRGTSARSVATAVVAVASAVGTWHGIRASWSSERFELEAIATARVDHYLAHLELPVDIVLFDPREQSVTGRVPGLHTHNIFGEIVEAVPRGVGPEEYAREIAADARDLLAKRGRLALDGGWREWAAVDPRIASYMLAVEDVLSAELATRWVGGEGVLLVVESPASD